LLSLICPSGILVGYRWGKTPGLIRWIFAVNNLRTFLIAAILLAATPAPQAPAQKPSNAKGTDECSIAGTVVKLVGGEPLRKAKVTIQSLIDSTQSTFTVTDSGGHFELKGLDPGGYELSVSRVGFVTYEYGQRKPGDPGATLTLRPGQQINDLLFRLIAAGVIAGRILDEDGEPLPLVEVSALREVYTNGKRSPSTAAIVETNDLGEYRLFGLPPGRYFVSALLRQWNRFGDNTAEPVEPTDESSQGYARMYYPGTADAGKANTIAVKTGEEIPSIELLMHQVPVYRVRGHVFNQITHKPGVGTSLVLVPKTTSHEWELTDQHATVQKPDGSFEIGEVLPGSYELIAYWFDEGRAYSYRTGVDVGGADVEGLGVAIGEGTSIKGRVIWDGRPALEKDELTVTPTVQDAPFIFAARARVNQDNSFTLKEVGDGGYTVDVSGQARNCYIKDVAYDGKSVLDEGFAVTRGSAAFLEITISSRGARVQGTVTNQDGLPAPGVWVALVPDATHISQHRLYKQQTTDQYGHFDLRGIAPGDYRLLSWDEVEEGAWEDPDFLKPFEEKKLGQRVTLQDGDTKSMNIVTINTGQS
jgi:protocatechuate 3,4-dioxygenase beta subunit